ncbi:MAG TPA: ATP-binding protein [Thermodesulfovibrionales bacterium]|nr:ATP-binding protein [Thermodesulfovibrionales bacterium]
MIVITEDTFEQFLQSANESSLIDLHAVTFADPFGMTGILETGDLLRSEGIRKTIFLPESEEVLKYLERMDFFKFAADYFTLEPSLPGIAGKYLRSSYSDVLLEITPIEKSDDIHFIVGKVKERGRAILAKHLHYGERAIGGFVVALSEVCQNIVEHSETKGFVGIQKYHFQNMDKNVVEIAVMDIGIGFRKSLSQRFPLKNDLDAIEKGLLHGASRFADAGRGHGLNAVRRFVNEWNGRLSIRSGTAKLSIIPRWSRGKKTEENLTYFPGAQIHIMLPEIRKFRKTRSPGIFLTRSFFYASIESIEEQEIAVTRYNLYRLLKEELKNGSSDLVTRPSGQAIRKRIECELEKEEEGAVIALDFSKIGIIDYSCADEVVAKLLSRLLSDEYGDRYIVLTGLNDNQKENIEVALERKELSVMARMRNGREMLLGRLNNYLRETLRFVMENMSITAKDLADALEIEANTSGTRLLNLQKKRLVKRVEEARDGGRVWVYEKIS